MIKQLRKPRKWLSAAVARMVPSTRKGRTVLCSECFRDEGLRIDAAKLGVEGRDVCPNCKSKKGKKLSLTRVHQLAWRFFVSGTTLRWEYGAAPAIQFNEYHYGDSQISPSSWLVNDTKIIEEAGKIGFFHYGPRLWMLGEVEPLKKLQEPSTRSLIIDRIIQEYPERILSTGATFYRIRINPDSPSEPNQYDSPPSAICGGGRLDSSNFPIMYGSQDLDVCIHECRATAEDEIYVATLKPLRNLRLLDLTHLLEEEGVTEFESLDMAVHMLFLARNHSYEISRAISIAAKMAGFDGIIYPSFFSLLRTGGHPFETAFGISLRRIRQNAEDYVRAYTIPNLALFGRPIDESTVRVECINRLILTQIGYKGHFGPVSY